MPSWGKREQAHQTFAMFIHPIFILGRHPRLASKFSLGISFKHTVTCPVNFTPYFLNHMMVPLRVVDFITVSTEIM